jgi:hypothetical protein
MQAAPFGVLAYGSRTVRALGPIALFTEQKAAALVGLARQDPSVTLDRAHAAPEENASTRILANLGFQRLGTVEDPEHDSVWRWVLRVN